MAPSKNWFGEEPGEYPDPENDGRTVVVKYTKNRKSMQCVHYANRTGEQCGRWSVPSHDRCKNHGGASGRIKHGRYSKYRGTLAKKAEEFINDPHLLSLRGEIGVLRALLDEVLVRFDTVLQQDDVDVTGIMMVIPKICDDIRKHVEALHKIEVGLHMTIDVKQVEIMMVQVVQVISGEVKDVHVRARIARGLQDLVHPQHSEGAVSRFLGESGAVGRVPQGFEVEPVDVGSVPVAEADA